MSEEERPNPDELLSRISAEEKKAEAESGRGKLKIFFGACAGVGKTYSMLSAGKSALGESVDVVVGLVETHGREETKKLLEGMPILPHREVQYRGTLIKEFDLDAALARKPQLILLDELAHSNAPGSRHPKRWQDVEELVAAGISVYTTINVQHLESLNDIVARITGVWVKETVPDAVFDKADEISLVDIPSEELLKRLKEGKVYIAPEAKKRAAQNFFKKSNLIALRELALRRTAERVDALMDVYKTAAGGAQGWSGADRILVCIGADQLSAKLVRVAKRMSSGLKAPWTAIYIENERHFRLSREGQEAVERTLRLAERMGGKTETIQGQRAPEEILNYAHAGGITKIIVGKVMRPRWRELLWGTLADQLIRRSGDIDVYVVAGEAGGRKGLTSPFWKTQTPWQAYLAAPAMAAFCTALLLPVQSFSDPADLVMAYLIGIVGVALRYGRGPSLLASLLSALCVNFFFEAPYYSFKMEQEKHIITFIALLLTGIIIGTQSARLRMQAISARKREKNTSSLFAMSRELTAARGKITLAQVAAQHIADILDSDVFLWLPDAKGQLQTVVAETEAEAGTIDPVREESVVNWAFTHRQNAGRGTDTLPSAKALYVPLLGSGGVTGVIGVMPHDEEMDAYSTDDVEMIEAFANVTASALERAASTELVEKTLIEAESEKLRNILLSSVSHDLRTPLAAITGAASTLLIEGGKITEEYKTELLRSIHEEGARLARMVTNLLDVSSLESGSVKLNKELYFIEELIGSALMRVESKLGNHKVLTNIEHGLPLLRMDGLLIEQVLINLLENAAEFTPAGTTITISAVTEKPDIHVIVADNGPGIPKGEEERIFDKFYTGARGGVKQGEEQKGGGLGLAICRGIIHAHGGKIWARNAVGGTGAVFTFTLPIRSQEGE
ncbi:MAG: sensor histidine kinase KdpD [Pseudomonadota bacterium]|nr:sensor histidine kinase KdpD [Pseudomonadota bacterium]MDE3038738.1 sensor histidine kinase KdpD [Pseudomonadota bacterium]